MDFYKKCCEGNLRDLNHLTSIYRYLQDKEAIGVVENVGGDCWAYLGSTWEYYRWTVRLEFWTSANMYQRVIAEATQWDRFQLITKDVWTVCIATGMYKGSQVPVTLMPDGTWTVHTYNGIQKMDVPLNKVNIVWDFNVRKQLVKEDG